MCMQYVLHIACSHVWLYFILHFDYNRVTKFSMVTMTLYLKWSSEYSSRVYIFSPVTSGAVSWWVGARVWSVDCTNRFCKTQHLSIECIKSN